MKPSAALAVAGLLLSSWVSGGELTSLPDDAKSVTIAFRNALREGQWDAALSYCSAGVRAKAGEYDTLGSFFQTVVPIEPLVRMKGFPISGSSKDSFSSFVRLPDSRIGCVTWSWSIHKDGESWRLDFQTAPLKQWMEAEVADIKSRRAKSDADLAALLPKLEHVRTRLSAVNGKRFKAGEFIAFRLELLNRGKGVLQYDAYQVNVNNSMAVMDSAGNLIPYSAGWFSTMSHPRPIQPGQTVVLFDNLDILTQYQVEKPGKYRVQFNGKGLTVGDDNVGAPKCFASNVVEIEID